jgi:hypothetical protein
LLEESELAQQAYEEDHKVWWREVKVLQVEPNSMYRKCKEAAHMVLADYPISQPCLDTSSIWTPIITTEVSKLQLWPL